MYIVELSRPASKPMHSHALSKAIRSMVDELCAEVRQEAGALVEAFAIPDALLGAEIV